MKEIVAVSLHILHSLQIQFSKAHLLINNDLLRTLIHFSLDILLLATTTF